MRFEQKWEGKNLSRADEGYFAARVPGNIQLDYGVAHGFGDVQYADNYRQYLPLENDEWEYRTRLSYQRRSGERIFFVCEGIDYRYDILLNGDVLYSYEGMYQPVELDMTDRLRDTEDILTVHIYPHPKRTGAAEGTRNEADASCKPPVCYGWDWNPRLLISGIWQDAYLETRDAYYIGNCEVLAALNDEMTVGQVSFSFDCSQPCTTALYDLEGNTVYCGSDTEITVDKPSLWWCNGQGAPYLYRWSIKNEKEERNGYIGFRKIKLVQNLGVTDPQGYPKSRYDAPATIELNGRRIMAKGSNWVNPELFWGQIDAARYDELLVLARDCNMNMLRVWGGAGINKDSFYDLCDQYGILVWQEFMLACNNYIGTSHYMEVLESEATAIIKRLRHHPSLAMWCGGNELFNGWSGMDDQSHPLRLLNKLCFEYDYQRPYLPTSPLIGMGHGGYRFYNERQGGEVFREFLISNHTAYTEFGVPSVADVEILRQIIPPEEQFPIAKTPSWVAHHAFDAWGEGAWLCMDTLKDYFGEPSSLEALVEGSNWLQSVGYQAAFEEMRKQWPHCSMMLNWCFNEPWMTAANNSIISYPAVPKPSYEFVKAAMRPKLFSARIEKFSWKEGETFAAELWLLNDTPHQTVGNVHATLELGDRVIDLLDWTAQADANSNTQGPTLRCVLPNVDADRMTLILQSDEETSGRYLLQYRPKKQVAPTVRTMNV